MQKGPRASKINRRATYLDMLVLDVYVLIASPIFFPKIQNNV